MPKVSVIIPNYNHAPYLEKRLQSILDQTYQDFEIIFLDDASTDNSLEIFTKFSDNPRICSIINETNSGSPFKQWNKGLEQATGEYIWIAESDDHAAPNFLETLVSILDNNPQVGLAYCRSWIIDEKDNILCSCRDWITYSNKNRWQKNFINSGIDECNQHMILENTILNASSVLTRRGILKRAIYTSEDLKLAGDWITWINTLLLADVAYIAKPLNYFRYHSQTIRCKSDLDGLQVKERYQIAHYIVNCLSCDQPIREKISQILCSKWIKACLDSDTKIPWNCHYSIFNLARRIDQKIVCRFLKEFYKNFLQRNKYLDYVHRIIMSARSLFYFKIST